ncbi:MAG: hypothetical protein LBH97_07475 [Treponema sp.]|jgi:hypothetical protein|nr:hypothetical protein [Treponema sp.]
MSLRRIGLRLFFPVFLLCASVNLLAQVSAAGETGAVGSVDTGPHLSLIPVLETALSGELRWRSDWPFNLPPDSFLIQKDQGKPLLISLSNGTETYNFRRDAAGRIREYPYFLEGSCLQVQIDYAPSGEIARISISGGSASSGGGPGNMAESLDVEFPSGAISSGSGAPAVRAVMGGAVFFIFFQKTGVSLSETWYNEGGNLLAYYRAALLRNVNPQPDGETWRISSLQAWTAEGLSTEEYYFDSEGNISEIRSLRGRYSALYRGERPVYWDMPESGRFFLQWDGQDALVRLSAVAPEQAADKGVAEYRYEYERDDEGNWVSRQDIEMIGSLGVFVPRPGRTWTRNISATEE